MAMQRGDRLVCRYSNRGFRKLPSELREMTDCVELDVLTCRKLVKLPRYIGELVALRHLHLSDCAIDRLPSSIGRLTGLWMLRLVRLPHLERLPPEIGGLVGLANLRLAALGLREVPQEIGALVGLEHLDICMCDDIHQLPASIGLLTGLDRLSLADMGLEVLPEEIGGLVGLTQLIINGLDDLEEVPRGIAELTALVELSLARCSQLLMLPQEVENMVGLRRLNLKQMRLLDHFEGVWKLTGLQDLNLCNTHANYVPDLVRMLQTKHSFQNISLINSLLDEDQKLEILHAMRQNPLDLCEGFRINGIRLDPTETNEEIIRGIFAACAVTKAKYLAFASASIAEVVEHVRPRLRVIPAGLGVIPQAASLTLDTLSRIFRHCFDQN
jgi:Leucine-rich repeat (LRR) protein